MKLDTEHLTFHILHRCNCGFCARRDLKTLRRFENAVAVTHPHSAYTIEQARRFNRLNLARSVLPARGRFNLPTEFLCDELHAVADTENGNAQVKQTWINSRSPLLINRVRATRKNDPFRLLLLDRRERRVERQNFRI